MILWIKSICTNKFVNFWPLQWIFFFQTYAKSSWKWRMIVFKTRVGGLIRFVSIELMSFIKDCPLVCQALIPLVYLHFYQGWGKLLFFHGYYRLLQPRDKGGRQIAVFIDLQLSFLQISSNLLRFNVIGFILNLI